LVRPPSTTGGWRIPFLVSLLRVAIAIHIRLSLQETPIFQDIKARGQTATNPWREAFMSQNLKYVLIATVVVLGQGCAWYSGQFWALYFLQTVQKLDVLTSIHRRPGPADRYSEADLLGLALRKIGRKPSSWGDALGLAQLLSALHGPRYLH
jgi:hypothetical protein